MRKGSKLPRYKCLKCGKEQSSRRFPPCRYCGAKNMFLKLIKYGWDGKIQEFKIFKNPLAC